MTLKGRAWLALWLVATAVAAQDKHFEHRVLRMAVGDWQYQVRVGYNPGTMLPVVKPAQIERVKSWSPLAVFAAEGRAEYLIANTDFGVSIGLRLEQKGAKNRLQVKDYHMQLQLADGSTATGNWNGQVSMKNKLTYLTVPMLINYHCSPTVAVSGGLFFSYSLDGKLTGEVSDGTLQRDETGEVIAVTRADYRYSGQQRECNWGLQVGAECRLYKRFAVTGEVTYALGDIFPDHFKGIPHALYPICLNIGLAYTF